jgi:hypothetical protein
MSHTTSPIISLRAATSNDGPALVRLAALDSADVPAGPVLVAEVDGEPQAAMSLRDGRVVADPFAHTAELVSLLRLRAGTVADPAPQDREAGPAGFARRLGLAA